MELTHIQFRYYLVYSLFDSLDRFLFLVVFLLSLKCKELGRIQFKLDLAFIQRDKLHKLL